MRKKVYLPRWQGRFVPALFALIWLVVTYEQFLGSGEAMPGVAYAVLTITFWGVGAMIYAMASGKLAAYEIEERESAGGAEPAASGADAASSGAARDVYLTDDERKIVGEIKAKRRIKNNDVQELLGVSDSTATRYLDELEEKQVIKQVGEGSAAYYERL